LTGLSFSTVLQLELNCTYYCTSSFQYTSFSSHPKQSLCTLTHVVANWWPTSPRPVALHYSVDGLFTGRRKWSADFRWPLSNVWGEFSRQMSFLTCRNKGLLSPVNRSRNFRLELWCGWWKLELPNQRGFACCRDITDALFAMRRRISSHAACRRGCVQQPCCIVMPSCTVLLFYVNQYIDLYCNMLIPPRVTLEVMSHRSRE